MSEHRLIERAACALTRFAEKARHAPEDKPELARFVTFLSRYADVRHHKKEELILFEAMAEAGFPRQGGPLYVMRREHEAGRENLACLRALSEQAPPWSAADRGELSAAVSGYAVRLLEHIAKEDRVLYPMARNRLPPPALAQIEAACRAEDVRWEASGELRMLLQLGEELVARHPGAARDDQLHAG